MKQIKRRCLYALLKFRLNVCSLSAHHQHNMVLHCYSLCRIKVACTMRRCERWIETVASTVLLTFFLSVCVCVCAVVVQFSGAIKSRFCAICCKIQLNIASFLFRSVQFSEEGWFRHKQQKTTKERKKVNSNENIAFNPDVYIMLLHRHNCQHWSDVQFSILSHTWECIVTEYGPEMCVKC